MLSDNTSTLLSNTSRYPSFASNKTQIKRINLTKDFIRRKKMLSTKMLFLFKGFDGVPLLIKNKVGLNTCVLNNIQNKQSNKHTKDTPDVLLQSENIHIPMQLQCDSEKTWHKQRSAANSGRLFGCANMCVCVYMRALYTLGLAGVTTCLHY